MLFPAAAPQSAALPGEQIHPVNQRVDLAVEVRTPQAEHTVVVIHKGISVQLLQVRGAAQIKQEQPARPDKQIQAREELPQFLRAQIVDTLQRAESGVHGAVQVQFRRVLMQEQRGNRETGAFFARLHQHFFRSVDCNELVPALRQLQAHASRAAAEV